MLLYEYEFFVVREKKWKQMVEGKHNHYIQSLTQLYRVIGSKAVIQYLERKLITHIL